MKKRPLSFYTLFFIFCMLLMRLSGLFCKMIISGLSEYEYGVITLMTISLPAFFQIFTNLFFHDLLSHSNKGHNYFGFPMLYSVITCLGIGIIFFVYPQEIFNYLNIRMDSWEIICLAFFIALLSNALIVNINGILRGYKKYSLVSSLSLAPSALRLVLLILAVYILGIASFESSLIIYALPTLLVVGYIFLKEWGALVKRLKQITIPPKDMLVFGFTVFVVSIFTTMTQSIAKIMISHNFGVDIQGYFDISLSLITIITFSFGAMQFISIPEATGNKESREILFKKGELGDIVRSLFSVLIYCVIIIFFYSSPIVRLLFGERYLMAADYVYILAIGYIFLFVQQFLAYMNISTTNSIKKHKKILWIVGVLILLFPFVLQHLMDYFGFMGAYICTTIFLVAYAISTIYYSNDRTPLIVVTTRIDRLLITALVTSCLLLYFKPSLLLGIILSSGTFGFLVFGTGYLHKDIVLTIFKKTTE